MIGRPPAVPSSARRRVVLVVLLATIGLVAACGGSETDVGPGPGRPDDGASSTSDAPDPDDSGDVETAESTSTTEAPDSTATTSPTTDPDAVTSTTFIVDESSENARSFTELAASGLVLTLEEQACTDAEVEAALDAGTPRLDAVVEGVKTCASPRAVDDFASVLISAGGGPLPPTEAACVANRLRSGDDYNPFWQALFDEDAFDFLAVELDVQDLYLDLYAECVSVGRALSEQLGGAGLSPPTIGCVDGLYEDREFVRTTIEADLSGDPEEVERVNFQISGCLSGAERDALGMG